MNPIVYYLKALKGLQYFQGQLLTNSIPKTNFSMASSSLNPLYTGKTETLAKQFFFIL